jgi:hypothetical protein
MSTVRVDIDWKRVHRENAVREENQEAERARQYDEDLQKHPATQLLKEMRRWPSGSLFRAVEYLLERARADDLGAP